jgi:hypothetical protein
MRIRAVLIAVVLAVALAACGNDNFRDVEGVKSQRPDLIENFNNLDGHPNIAMVCIHGVAFYTTTRDLQSIGRVPEWDSRCPHA